jgi:methionyl aminopeptidase
MASQTSEQSSSPAELRGRYPAYTISRPLHPEDIINIDLTLYLNGFHGDTSMTFLLPEVDKQGRELAEATKEALEVGIRACAPGKRFGDIGREIQ